ncbi:hypothetical protein SAMN02799625_06064 [Methylobacterium sp. UNC300MFChir4.1]|uniref:hypothetical protein n=1 Tax=Methylobacterium sp. UNC300MFChir4.1 TaxID=1502747 RepID=UPI0008C67981|nr:hypothetical protein [Methylobacterium sp. UNC300MFChir4.1]SEP41572.1 hypothetical protein SAMN02799625_06064 [Methylobacterium sp. UNC300MFChir4.1]
MSSYNLSKKILDALADLRSREHNSSKLATQQHASQNSTEDCFVFDAKRDTQYAHGSSSVFNDTIFLFTQQWVGIRQACGAFPVDKIAIDGHHKWTTKDALAILEELERRNIKRIVAHGMAPTTKYLLTALKSAHPEIKISVVWHGTMAGWAFDHELRLFQDAVGLADENIVNKIGFLRRGMGEVHSKGWHTSLVNISPAVNINRITPAFSSKPINCLFASWNNQWKNMYTNLVGAEACDQVRNIICYQSMEGSLLKKVRTERYDSFKAHMTRLAIVDLCLNVSINDCQPMTELESIAVGTPSLRPNLDHGVDLFSEYDRLFTVNEYLNARSISDRISMLCKEEPTYLKEVIDGYKDDLIKLSYNRYSDFLGDD